MVVMIVVVMMVVVMVVVVVVMVIPMVIVMVMMECHSSVDWGGYLEMIERAVAVCREGAGATLSCVLLLPSVYPFK